MIGNYNTRCSYRNIFSGAKPFRITAILGLEFLTLFISKDYNGILNEN